MMPNFDSEEKSRKRIKVSSEVAVPAHQRPKLLSTIGNVRSQVAANSNFSGRRMGGKSDALESETPVVNEANSKPEMVQRNKRLFGALMGHLGKAKRKLEEDSSTIEKQVSLQMAVTQKNSEESKRLFQLHKELTNAEKEKVKSNFTTAICVNTISMFAYIKWTV
jgi:hypothetical protein